MSSMMRDDLIQRLKDLDEEASLLFGEAERLHMVIVGGGALILMELLPRATHDIDVLDSSRKLHSLMESYDINTRVQTYINNFPITMRTGLYLCRISKERLSTSTPLHWKTS